MRPLAEFPTADRHQIKIVLTDIDDTLTEAGRMPATAYMALERLKRAGLIVIPVTGRSAGWCDLIARQWPVDGVVGENGAFSFHYDGKLRRMVRRYARPEEARSEDCHKLKMIREEVLAEVPGAAISADQAYREADLAIDFCEDVPALPIEAVQRIASIFARHGAKAKVSSIHVNGWFGAYDKLSTSRSFLQEQFGISVDLRNEAIVFAGDSPNDAPMFGFFRNSVGVANVRDFEGALTAAPVWITAGRGSAGFIELADALLDGRR